MSQAESDRAVREAQQYAAQDAQTKAEATAKDRCEYLMYQAATAKTPDKACKKQLAEAVKAARQAVKSKDPLAMNNAANELERLLHEAGCTVDPNASYHPNTNHSDNDDAMDADFEEV